MIFSLTPIFAPLQGLVYRSTLGWQRRYEALRASFVERMSAKAVAERFGYSAEYVRLLRHLFVSEKLDFTDPVPEGKAARRAVTTEIRKKTRALREKQFSASEISRLLSEEGLKISVRTVERVLADVTMTMIADTIYYMFAQRLRGF